MSNDAELSPAITYILILVGFCICLVLAHFMIAILDDLYQKRKLRKAEQKRTKKKFGKAALETNVTSSLENRNKSKFVKFLESVAIIAITATILNFTISGKSSVIIESLQMLISEPLELQAQEEEQE